MSTSWPVVRLDEVLSHRRQFVTIDDLQVYKRPRVQLHAQGIVLRDQVPGALIKTKEQQVCRAGEFLVAEIDAKVGGFGIVPPEMEGSVVSSHYFLFKMRSDRLERRFLGWFIKTPAFRTQVEAQGSTNYAAIRPNDVLGYEIPLPPLAEQQRIVARIEALAAKIAEARGLRQQAMAEAEALVWIGSTRVICNSRWETQPVERVLAEPPRNGLSPKAEVQHGGMSMLRINAVSSTTTRFVNISAIKLVEAKPEEVAPFTLRNDDVFIVRYNGDIHRVGKAAIFKGVTTTAFPDKLMRLRPRPEQVLPDFLVYALNSQTVRNQIEDIGKTTAGQIGISGGNAKTFIVPTPPLAEQRHIVSYLDGLQAKVDALKRLQAETAAELDAMLPAILDRAFKGEL